MNKEVDTVNQEVEKVEPEFHTEKELIGEVNSISASVAKAIHGRKELGHTYGPEVVAALASSINNILIASNIHKTSTLRLALTIVRREIWETCHEQYNIEEEVEDVIGEKSD